MGSKHGSKSKRQKTSTGKERDTSAALPLIFGMSLEQAARLKRIPLDSLNKFQEHKAEKIDSTNIYLRLMTGLHIVEHVIKTHDIDGDVLDPLKNAITAMRAVMFRNDELPQTEWRMSPGEIVLIIEALDIVDQLQDQITRRDMLMSFRASQAIIEKNFRTAYPERVVPKEIKDQIV